MSLPTNDPIIKQLQLLLTGYGYNFYDRKNQVHADDILVRQKAGSSLNQAAELLSQLAVDYQRRYIPPATRENPWPSAEAMTRLNAIKTLRDDVSSLEVHIRSMSVPSQDRVWWRYRDELSLLQQLLSFDLGLISESEAIYTQVRGLTADDWTEGQGAEIAALVRRLNDVARDRERFLMIPR